MKTIEMVMGGQKVQFTTKSVIFGGKEYFYTQMSQVKHSSAKHIYAFTYDGEMKLLPYDEKDGKILGVIFSQVMRMQAAKAQETQEEPVVQEETPEVQEEVPAEEETNEEETSEESTEASAEVAEEVAEEEVSEESTEENTEENTEEKEKVDLKKKFNDFIAGIKAKFNKASDDENAEEAEETEKEEKLPMDPEKKEKLKRSLKIFGIVLAAIIVCSVIYFFVFGTNNAPSESGPNITESQQYEDIDQLIDDMQ